MPQAKFNLQRISDAFNRAQLIQRITDALNPAAGSFNPSTGRSPFTIQLAAGKPQRIADAFNRGKASFNEAKLLHLLNEKP